MLQGEKTLFFFLIFQFILKLSTSISYLQGFILSVVTKSSLWQWHRGCPVMPNSLWPHGLQHTRPPCPLPSPEVCPSSCPLHPWCHPAISSSDDFFSFCPHSFQHQGLSNDSTVYIRWPKHWNFSFIISPSTEHSGLTSLKIAWFDLLAVQGTFRSLLRHHGFKASIFWHSVIFTVQLLQP